MAVKSLKSAQWIVSYGHFCLRDYMFTFLFTPYSRKDKNAHISWSTGPILMI